MSELKLSLIGYGKIGKLIHDLAPRKNCTIKNIVTSKDPLETVDLTDTIGIDFTTPTAFKKNYRLIADHCAAAVVGTTGWEEIQPEVLAYFQTCNTPLIYGSNFSIGANLYFKIIQVASKLIAKVQQYEPALIEMHHRTKLDRPSGTAKRLLAILQQAFAQEIEVATVRSGWIKGIHEVRYESLLDKITIQHEAYSRDGFAEGALLAARLAVEHPGCWEFSELLTESLDPELNRNLAVSLSLF